MLHIKEDTFWPISINYKQILVYKNSFTSNFYLKINKILL